MKNIILKILIVLSFLFINIFPQRKPFTYRLDKSNSLKKIAADDTPDGNNVQEILSVGDTLITFSGGLNISTDRGQTWNNFYGKEPFGNDGIYAIGYNKGAIWVSTGVRYYSETEGSVDSGKGLKVTTDLGKTWRSIPQPVDDISDSSVTYGNNKLKATPITVIQQNVTFDIAFTPGTVWITSFAGGLRKSTDNGNSWQRVVLPPDYLNHIAPTDTLDFTLAPRAGTTGNLNHSAFSVVSINDSTLYVGTAGGINKSTDDGISWTKFNYKNQQNPIGGDWVTYLDYNKTTNTVWATSWKAEGQDEIFCINSTTDGGQNWSVFLPGIKALGFGFKNDEVISCTTEGVFRSSNSGKTWISPTSIIDSDSKLSLHATEYFDAAYDGKYIWLGTDDGLVRFDQTGVMWEGNWKIYLASQQLATANESYCFPNPYYPRFGTLKIKYSTGNSAQPVTIRIYDFGMNYVRTIIQNVQRGGGLSGSSTVLSETDLWDGKDESGKVVPNGVYFYRIDRGSEEPLFGKILVIQ